MVMTVIWGGWQGNDHSNVLTEERFAVRLTTKVETDAEWKPKYTELETRATHVTPSGW